MEEKSLSKYVLESKYGSWQGLDNGTNKSYKEKVQKETCLWILPENWDQVIRFYYDRTIDRWI